MKRLLLHLLLLCSSLWVMAQNEDLISLMNTCLNYQEVAEQLPSNAPLVVLDNGTVPKDRPLQFRGQDVLLLNLEDISQRALKENLRFSQVVYHNNKAYVVMHLPQKQLKVTLNLLRNQTGWQVENCSHRYF